MYEIWLAINIVWEYFLLHSLLFVLYAIILLLVWGIALRRHGRAILRPPFCQLIGSWLIGTVIAMLVVPWLTSANHADLDYWVDWANLFAIAAGCGVALALLAWPLAAICPACCARKRCSAGT